MTKKEIKKLYFEDDIEPISKKSDTSWRHGTNEVWVFNVKRDEYWMVSFRLSGDSEWNGFLEDDFDLSRVYPHVVKSVVYKDYPAELENKDGKQIVNN